VPESSSTTESILSSFLQIDVETSTLKKVLKMVRENKAQSNLLSFHRPSSAADYQGKSNEASKILSTPKHLFIETCPYCKALKNDADRYRRVCRDVFEVHPRW